MHDAISAEQAGKPAAAVMTDRFIESARLMAEVCGLPGYPFAVIPHPISSRSDAELRASAEEAARQCDIILRSR